MVISLRNKGLCQQGPSARKRTKSDGREMSASSFNNPIIFSLSLNWQRAFLFRFVEVMKPVEGLIQESGKENASAVSAPDPGGVIRRNTQYLVGKCIMLPNC
ncbi:MAG: hypothetical protein D3924_01525 [Candidatus Electrothrix sp. AR4]|nr:hypothetical protein [Candidatus Electrothrix sp. AR4]